MRAFSLAWVLLALAAGSVVHILRNVSVKKHENGGLVELRADVPKIERRCLIRVIQLRLMHPLKDVMLRSEVVIFRPIKDGEKSEVTLPADSYARLGLAALDSLSVLVAIPESSLETLQIVPLPPQLNPAQPYQSKGTLAEAAIEATRSLNDEFILDEWEAIIEHRFMYLPATQFMEQYYAILKKLEEMNLHTAMREVSKFYASILVARYEDIHFEYLSMHVMELKDYGANVGPLVGRILSLPLLYANVSKTIAEILLDIELTIDSTLALRSKGVKMWGRTEVLRVAVQVAMRALPHLTLDDWLNVVAEMLQSQPDLSVAAVKAVVFGVTDDCLLSEMMQIEKYESMDKPGYAGLFGDQAKGAVSKAHLKGSLTQVQVDTENDANRVHKIATMYFEGAYTSMLAPEVTAMHHLSSHEEDVGMSLSPIEHDDANASVAPSKSPTKQENVLLRTSPDSERSHRGLNDTEGGRRDREHVDEGDVLVETDVLSDEQVDELVRMFEAANNVAGRESGADDSLAPHTETSADQQEKREALLGTVQSEQQTSFFDQLRRHLSQRREDYAPTPTNESMQSQIISREALESKIGEAFAGCSCLSWLVCGWPGLQVFSDEPRHDAVLSSVGEHGEACFCMPGCCTRLDGMNTVAQNAHTRAMEEEMDRTNHPPRGSAARTDSAAARSQHTAEITDALHTDPDRHENLTDPLYVGPLGIAGLEETTETVRKRPFPKKLALLNPSGGASLNATSAAFFPPSDVLSSQELADLGFPVRFESRANDGRNTEGALPTGDEQAVEQVLMDMLDEPKSPKLPRYYIRDKQTALGIHRVSDAIRQLPVPERDAAELAVRIAMASRLFAKELCSHELVSMAPPQAHIPVLAMLLYGDGVFVPEDVDALMHLYGGMELAHDDAVLALQTVETYVSHHGDAILQTSHVRARALLLRLVRVAARQSFARAPLPECSALVWTSPEALGVFLRLALDYGAMHLARLWVALEMMGEGAQAADACEARAQDLLEAARAYVGEISDEPPETLYNVSCILNPWKQ